MGTEKKYYIETYGCEMNKSDSIDIALCLQDNGYEQAKSGVDADVVILNTCAVRENAEERIFGRLGYYRALRKSSVKRPLIVLAGCMAQEKGEEITRLFPEVNIIAGTYHMLDIPAYVKKFEEEKSTQVAIDKSIYRFSEYKRDRAEGYKAWVNIIKGCSNYCSYCIVPYLRGHEISKKSENILREVRDLALNGVVEITLLGQNVNAYGRDNNDISFNRLLGKINDIDGIEWIRFLTSHPKDYDEEIVRRISELPKVCKHFHLPLQSGSDRILSLMNRKYTIYQYSVIIEAIRKYMPHASITTDIIVGFPTETERDFHLTLDAVQNFQFDDAFTYRYSERPFTRAADIGGKVHPTIAKRRLEELIEIQRNISYKKNKNEIGRRKRVLIERMSKKDPSEFLCKTEIGKLVVVRTKARAGKFIDVMINDISGNTLRGAEL